MVGLAFLFIALAAWAVIKRNAPTDSPLLLKLLPWAIPLPYLANELGWTVAEVGRQPWIVYGIMRTSDAVSPLATSQVAISAVAFIVVYTLLGIADFYLLFKVARKGPKAA
jgi:cytochrome d ubiquinol oxidase subunit I